MPGASSWSSGEAVSGDQQFLLLNHHVTKGSCITHGDTVTMEPDEEDFPLGSRLDALFLFP